MVLAFYKLYWQVCDRLPNGIYFYKGVWIGISIGISIGKIFSSVLRIESIWEQVDILISKNQALQILYLKHIKLHKLPWTETHENLIPTKSNNDTA